MNLIKLFLKLLSRKKKDRLGYAVLKKDVISGKKQWVTWDTEGKNKIAYDLDAPLIFPSDKLPTGTYIELYREK